MPGLSYLAFAAGYRRVSFVLIENGNLATWHTSCLAAKSSATARAFANEFIDLFRPDVIVLEYEETAKRKSEKTRALLEAFRNEAERASARLVRLERVREFRTRQAEAEHLAKLYPEFADMVPRRGYCENEPHHAVLFEALALAHHAVRGGAMLLASKM